ncbi:hypothetical protein, partial [Escherichia coli]
LILIAIPAKYIIVSHFGLTVMLIWYKCSFKKHIDRQLNIRG